MASSDLRDGFQDALLARVRESRYPSIELMNRIEASLRDVDSARAYAQVLQEKIEADTYPSLQLVDRLSGLIDLIERAEAAQQAVRASA